MKQWDIFLFPHPSPDNPHPCVVISNDAICSNPQIGFINILACQSVRPPTRPPKANEVYLNSADGLDGKTLVKCDFVLTASKNDALSIRGEVSPARIAEIRARMRQFF
jgi:mRNA-degrading endonuclease toxin of MazEF toxin-antitoxin module